MHKVESAIPLKYKNCRRVPRSENSSSTSIDNLIERINQDEEVPRMKLLQINYVNSSQKSANLPPNGANIHSEDGCNGRPPLYKYAVYKKINGLESKIEDHSENHSKNRQLHEEKNMQCERTRKLEKRIRQRDVKCKSENLGTEKSDSWDFRTPPTEVFCKAPLRGVKTRASRIEKIEKINSSSNSGSSSRSSSGSNSSGVPPTHVPRSVPSDIARISKMFEQARRDNEEEDSLTRAHLSKVAGGGKIKRLVDNFENKCHCKDNSLSSNSSVSEPRRPDVAKLQSPKEPKLNIFPPPRSPRFDETNEKINQQIKQIFEKSSRNPNHNVQNRRDYSTRQQQHHHQTDHDRSSHQRQERNLQNQLEKHLKGRDRDVSPHQRRDLRSFDHSHNHLGRQRDSNGSGNQTRPPSGEERTRNQSPHYHKDLRPQDQSPKMRGSSGIDSQNRLVKQNEGKANQNLSPRRRSNDQSAKLRGSGINNNSPVTYQQDRLAGYHQSPEVPHRPNRGDRAPQTKDYTPRVQAKSPQNNPDRSNISERDIFPRDRQERSTNSNLLDCDRSRYHQQRDSSPHDQRVPLLGHRKEERSMQQHHGRQRCPIELKKCAKSPTRPGDNVPQRHHKSVLEELAAEIQSKKMLKNRQQIKEQPLLVNCCDGTETEMNSGHTKPPVNQSNRDHSSKVRVSGLKEPQVHSAKLDKLDNQKQNGANDSKRNTCGYKNCTFNNCPMSPVTSQSGSGDDELVTKNKKLINCNSTCISPPPVAKQDNIILESKKLEKSVKIMVNVSSGKLDECKEVSPPPPLHRPQPASLADTANLSTKYSDLNDLQNFSGKNVTKATTNELLELNSSLNNTVAKNSKPKSNNIDVNLKNNENRKFNDLKSGSSPHSLKIFVRSSTCSASSKGSVSSETSSLTDSDYGYYDHVAESVNSTGVETDVVVPTEISVQSNKKSGSEVQIQSVFGSKLGCDGAIFWNNCYFYDDNNFCMTCTNENSSPDYEMNNRSRYVCVCPAKKVDLHDMRPRSMEGAIDSGVSINGDTGSSPDSDISSQHLQNQPDAEAKRLKRGHVLTELLETERIYVSEMCSILKGYRNQMLSEEMAPLVPPSLQGKEDILFGNLHELYTFHNDVFLKDLENCISTTELVALCFVQRRDTFYRLYSFYCQNIPRSERLRETLVDAHLFLQECQKRLGHKLPLAAYLLKPVQRITKYQLLLKDLLRFSDSGTCAKELQKALDCMLIVLKCVNDSMHQIAITGFPADLSQQGELLLQDSFQVWTESKKDIRLRLKTQQRHIFLYQKAMLFCKQGSKTGHNKSTYQYKHYVKMSQIGLTESVRGDPKRFEVWLQGRQEVHTLQAPTIEIKNKWVAEIKRVLLNQLEELKGEKIKQYGGLNHKPLRQAASWDTPCPALSIPQRTMSCDTGGSSSDASNRNSNGSDECCPPQTPGISSSSSERGDNPDVSGWSSDYSNSEDELSMIEDSSTPTNFTNYLAQWAVDGACTRGGAKSNSTFYVSVE